MRKRILTFLLSFLIFIPCVAIFVACGSNNEGAENKPQEVVFQSVEFSLNNEAATFSYDEDANKISFSGSYEDLDDAKNNLILATEQFSDGSTQSVQPSIFIERADCTDYDYTISASVYANQTTYSKSFYVDVSTKTLVDISYFLDSSNLEFEYNDGKMVNMYNELLRNHYSYFSNVKVLAVGSTWQATEVNQNGEMYVCHFEFDDGYYYVTESGARSYLFDIYWTIVPKQVQIYAPTAQNTEFIYQDDENFVGIKQGVTFVYETTEQQQNFEKFFDMSESAQNAQKQTNVGWYSHKIYLKDKYVQSSNYVFEVYGSDNVYYNSTDVPEFNCYFEIYPKYLVVEDVAVTGIYNYTGEQITPTTNIDQYVGKLFAIDYPTAVNAGTYEITVSAIGDIVENYCFPSDIPLDADYEVTRTFTIRKSNYNVAQPIFSLKDTEFKENYTFGEYWQWLTEQDSLFKDPTEVIDKVKAEKLYLNVNLDEKLHGGLLDVSLYFYHNDDSNNYNKTELDAQIYVKPAALLISRVDWMMGDKTKTYSEDGASNPTALSECDTDSFGNLYAMFDEGEETITNWYSKNYQIKMKNPATGEYTLDASGYVGEYRYILTVQWSLNQNYYLYTEDDANTDMGSVELYYDFEIVPKLIYWESCVNLLAEEDQWAYDYNKNIYVAYEGDELYIEFEFNSDILADFTNQVNDYLIDDTYQIYINDVLQQSTDFIILEDAGTYVVRVVANVRETKYKQILQEKTFVIVDPNEISLTGLGFSQELHTASNNETLELYSTETFNASRPYTVSPVADGIFVTYLLLDSDDNPVSKISSAGRYKIIATFSVFNGINNAPILDETSDEITFQYKTEPESFD